jgi:4-methyl-5(b-hydroxyethyl)-thiazole monophosphate biosynthesis
MDDRGDHRLFGDRLFHEEPPADHQIDMSHSTDIKVLVPLASGFEEIEAIVPVDIFRRAGWQVITAGLEPGPVNASRQTCHLPDALLADVIEAEYDLIYLPGGLPGADHLASCGPLVEKVRQQYQAGRWLAAICAAPRVLAKAEVLNGRRFTAHPTSRADLEPHHSTGSRLEVDGRLITAIGAGASYEIALQAVASISGSLKLVQDLNGGLCCPETLLPARI